MVGQSARFAVEVAAAGAHHLMLTGPPGVGKTMLAQRPGPLPPLSDSESLEVTAIHSVAGLLSADTPLVRRPPFVAPHHNSTVAALVGGGSGMARPGAVSSIRSNNPRFSSSVNARYTVLLCILKIFCYPAHRGKTFSVFIRTVCKITVHSHSLVART